MYLELNERDYQILATLYLLRISTANQLNALYFSAERTTRARLSLFKELKYIDIKPFAFGSRRRCNVYLLTHKGVCEARNWLERTYNRKLPKLKHALSCKLYYHELLIVDVFTKLVQEKIVRVEDLFIGKFLDTRLAPVLPSVFDKKAALKPDARFEFNGVDFWVEVDRGTESTSIIKQKLMSYQMHFSANPEGRHTVLFLVDGVINWRRFHEIRAFSSEYIGPHNNGGKINWYTFAFEDLDSVIKRFIQPNFFLNCIKRLSLIGCYKESMRKQVAVFDHTFLPTALMPAAWLGFKDFASDYEQFYVVESIVGGESGALHRLKQFDLQLSEFYNKRGGKKIKPIVIIDDPRDLDVIKEMYPKLINDLIHVSISELKSGKSQILIARKEN